MQHRFWWGCNIFSLSNLGPFFLYLWVFEPAHKYHNYYHRTTLSLSISLFSFFNEKFGFLFKKKYGLWRPLQPTFLSTSYLFFKCLAKRLKLLRDSTETSIGVETTTKLEYTLLNPIDRGGLSLVNSKNENQALQAKWICHYQRENSAQWRRIIEAINGTSPLKKYLELWP